VSTGLIILPDALITGRNLVSVKSIQRLHMPIHKKNLCFLGLNRPVDPSKRGMLTIVIGVGIIHTALPVEAFPTQNMLGRLGHSEPVDGGKIT